MSGIGRSGTLAFSFSLTNEALAFSRADALILKPGRLGSSFRMEIGSPFIRSPNNADDFEVFKRQRCL